MSDRIDTRLVADALEIVGAFWGRRTGGTVFHSDRGSQYRGRKHQAKQFEEMVL